MIRVACTFIVEHFYRKISDVIVCSSVEEKIAMMSRSSLSGFRETVLPEIVE